MTFTMLIPQHLDGFGDWVQVPCAARCFTARSRCHSPALVPMNSPELFTRAHEVVLGNHHQAGQFGFVFPSGSIPGV